MALRIGFDMDGVLADFESAFNDVEVRLFGADVSVSAGQPEKEEERQAAEEADEEARATGRIASAREQRRRRDAIWRAIQATPDFWETLQPTSPGVVSRVHALMLQHRWEVFFITQRPATEGNTVQRQTQRWLVKQGFDLPSVLVIAGSRGAAAGALRLNYHVDDSPQNCIDVISDSRAKPILIVPHGDPTTVTSTRKLGIGTAASVGECLDILEEASLARSQPGLLQRLAATVGWK
jgi:beta-phosphoglucomutase-like phosphatase (HAD superfamily)